MTRPTALLLHGFTGAGSSWRELAAVLSDCFTPICPDLPGHVAAPLPQRLGREGFDATVEALARLIPEPSLVIGYSQGARLALALAIRHPRRVTRLVLESGTAGLTHRDRGLRHVEDEAHATQIETRGVDTFIEQWERLPLLAGARDDRALAARRRSHTAPGLAGALRCLGLGVQPNFWPALPRLRTATLLLTGAQDSKFEALAHRMAAALPRARHVSVPGIGHAVHLEAPQIWAAEVRAFIRTPFPADHHEEEVRT